MKQAIVSLALILALLPAASAQQGPALANPLQPIASVIVLPPQVAYEQLSANSRGGYFGSGSFESTLTNAAHSNLSARNYALVAPESLQNPNAVDWLNQLQPLTSRLARGAINDEAQQILNRLATLPGDYLIYVQFMRVKQGPGGSWNPNTGAITSQMSSTLLQGALISTRTAQVTWKNEVFERKALRVDDSKFAKLVDLLYQTLGTNGGNR